MRLPAFPRLSSLSAVFLGVALPVFADTSALGRWEFDSSRKNIYTESVVAAQTGGDLSEIAAQMGMAATQNSTYEFSFDAKGPFLRITDKATSKTETQYLTVKRQGQILHMTPVEGAGSYRIEPAGADAITLFDLGRKLTIPLRRLS